MRSLIADDSTRPQLRFHLPLDPARLLRARHRIRDFLHEHDVQPRAIEEIVLAVEEAMTNAVRYSGGEDLAVGLGFDGTDVIAVVRDHGRGFDVASFDPERIPDPLAPSGRGLFLIAHLMDELELRSQGGMVVRAVKRDVLGAGEGTEPGLGESVPGARAHRDARQQAMLDEVEEAFFALDWEYRYLYVNRAAEMMWRRRKEDHLGHSLWQVYPRVPPIVSQALRDTMELGIPTLVEAASFNGGKWREYRAYPTSFGVAAYVRDIDERKRKELERDELLAALRKSEKRLSALVSASSEVLYRMDPGWSEMRELRGHGFLADTGEADRHWLDRYIPSEDQPQVLRAIAQAIDTKQVFELEHRVQRADGQLGWVASRAVPILDENGAIREWFGAASDINDRKQAESMRLRYELLAGESQDIILFLTPHGKIVDVNRSAEEAYGYSRQELLALSIQDLRAEQTRSDVARQIAEADACGIRFETVHRRKSGELFPVEVCARGGQIEGRRLLVSVVRDVTERKRLEERLRHGEAEKDRLYALEQQRRGRLEALRQALEVALSSPEPEEASRRMLAYLVAEHGFEYANVWLAENGFLTLLGAVGYPDIEAYAERTSPTPLSSPLDVVKVFTSGQPVTVSDATTANPAVRELYANLGLVLGAYVILPLTAHGTTVGALNFGWREPRSVDPDDLDFYLSLSSELGVVLENARLFKAQQRIATTLQENLVHPLPRIEGLELASLSLPAHCPELVGGDFRDVFRVSDTRVAVLIGDVMGKGMKAAGLTETVHSAVRALALVTASPAKILRHVNRLLLAEEHEQFVTALVAVIDLTTGRCRVASAAHPPPVLLSRDKASCIEPRYGPPLGTFEAPYAAHEFDLACGETLIFYTDGLTEARREGQLFGEARLLAALADHWDLRPEALVGQLRDAVLAYAGALQDDLEILAVRRGEPSETQ